MLEQVKATQSVGQCVEAPANAVTGMLTIGRKMAYFTTANATYDVIADAVQVKELLSSKKGAFVAELTGKPYPRQTGGTGFATTAISIKSPLAEHSGTYSRPHGPGSAWSMTIDGKTYELHPKTDRAKLQLDDAGTFGQGMVTGVIKGDAIEVWEVSMPMRRPFPIELPPVMQTADPSQQQSSFERVGQQTKL